MMPTREALLATADALPARPVAIEALWDGDTTGWMVWLAAVLPDGAGFRSHHLASLRDGGDFRLFNGQVPPWPEAQLAAAVGVELAERFGVPFHFPSPDHPEDDCPSWTERDRGIPCGMCGIPLLQWGACPWRGVCYHCHLAREREARGGSSPDAEPGAAPDRGDMAVSPNV